MSVQTKIITYANEKDMKNGIKKMEKIGWQVINTQIVNQGYSGCKTCCLGLLFLPLALLGRKANMYQVTFQRQSA